MNRSLPPGTLFNQSPGGEGLHGWMPDVAKDDPEFKAERCLTLASDAIRAEPFGYFMRCVMGECPCKRKAKPAQTPLEQERAAILSAVGGSEGDDLPVGSKRIGFYNWVTKTWSASSTEPERS